MFGLTPINRRNSLSRWPRSIFDVESWFDSFFNDSFSPAVLVLTIS